MRAELVHTSLVRGLDGGTGFAVACRTGGMPRALADALAAMSGLPEAWANADDLDRTLRATRCLEWQGERRWVASVVRPCGVDHTGRGNRIAHHRLLEPDETARACPVAMLLDHERWMARWEGEPREVDAPAGMPSMAGSSGAARGWGEAFGDAGVAAAALERAFRSGIGAWIVVPEGCDRLALLAELAGLLPLEKRWKRGWSTRPLRPSADGAPVIGLVDEREPEVAHASAAPWVIRASGLPPEASEALLARARGGGATGTVSASSGGSGPIAWSPPRRLAVPSGMSEMAERGGMEDSISPVASAAIPPTIPVSLEPVPPARGARRIIVASVLLLIAFALWWMLRGGGS